MDNSLVSQRAFHDILRAVAPRVQEPRPPIREVRAEPESARMVGESPSIREVLRQVETVAATQATVLVCGETGTGKELIARAIHDLSARRSGPFVKLNCAALPAGLLESELFGHERGAFTGAVARRVGRFELAQDGTIFLDEVGELGLTLQPKLLRLLQEREFERLGSSRTQHSNARLVAATNRDLGAMVATHSFREDLYYRLNVFPIYLPPLRERRGDIALLARHFVTQLARRMEKEVPAIAPSTIAKLERHHWPGNIRELQNVLERAVILATGAELDVQLGQEPAFSRAPAEPRAATSCSHLDPRASTSGDAQEAHTDALDEVNRAHILSVLEATDWVVAGPKGAAARLGLKRSTLNFRMKKLGIVRELRRAGE